MEHFVSVIFETDNIDEDAVVEAILDSLDAPLTESENEYGLFESDNNTVVLRMALPYSLDDDASEAFANALSERMLKMNYNDFAIETTLTEATLKRGSKGKAVKKLQYDLGVQPADGDFGPATEKAVKDFQRRYKLKVDGIVGPNTAKQIARSASISTKDEPEYHKSVKGSDFGALSAFSVSRRGGLMNNPKQVDAIKELQKELKRRGWYEGEIDGKYGPQTKSAVANFQSKMDLYRDGDAGPKTINALMQRDSDISVQGLDDIEPGDDLTQYDMDSGNMPDESDPTQDAGGNSMFDTDVEDQAAKGYFYVMPAPQGAGFIVVGPDGVVDRSINNNMGRTSSEEKAQEIADRRNKQQGLDPDAIDADDIAQQALKALNITPGDEPRATSIDDIKKWDAEILPQLVKGKNKAEVRKLIQDYYDNKEFIKAFMLAYRANNTAQLSDEKIAQLKRKAEEQAELFAGNSSSSQPEEPKSDDDQKGNEIETISGLPVLTSVEDAEKFVGDNSEKENEELVIKILTRAKQVSGSKAKKLYKSAYYILSYDERVPVSQKTFDKITKLAGLEESMQETFEQEFVDEVTLDGDEFFEQYGVMWFNEDDEIDEAEYQGRKVKLGKPMRGDVKKFKVYVKNPKGNVVKVNFGDPDMKIKKSNPARRRSFRARHNCDNPGPRHKARYWSCRKW